MKMNRNNQGFTLAEMLIVVAITVILMGVAFIGVQSYQRSSTRLEFDTIAKEIFIAAQNHLTTAQSQGYLQLNSKADGSKASADKAFGLEGNSGADTNGDEHYFVYSKTSSPYSTDPQEVQSVLDLMLPFGSIDETVRAGGTYIIRYQPSSGRVLDVFYSLPGKSSMLTVSGVELAEGHYSSLMASGRSDEAAGRSFRERFSGTINGKSVTGVVGWYGGEEGLPIGTRLKDPEIIVHNEEVLWVEVKNNNTEGSWKLIVTGATSGAQKAFDPNDVTSTVRIQDGSVADTVNVILDDITTSGLHFAELGSDVSGKSFIPGENVIIEAVAYNNGALTNVAYSGKKTTNSLFADLEEVTTSSNDKEHIALIENFRHLENLDAKISSFSYNTAIKGEEIKKAKQIKDLDWNSDKADSFIKAVTAINRVAPASVYDANNTAVTEGSRFYPVSPAFALSYDGESHKVSNVTVNHSGAAGLFGVLADESEVKDLELIGFDVTATGEGKDLNAGALVGTATGTAITNVLAYNTDTGFDPTISGTGSVGGLIGSATNCMVSKCGAALVVTSPGGNAGGLIGTSSGGTVEASYSGGHTKDAKYYNGDTPIYNVISTGGNAGGLIGDAGSAEIKWSYSTCSAAGDTAGGFVGTSSGTITGCYCTGLVVAPMDSTANHGAFAGGGSITTDPDKPNYYFEIINELKDASSGGYTYLTALGNNGTNDNIKAFDKTAASYDEFSGAPTGWETAKPYDEILSTYYQSSYNLKTVKQLGSQLPDGYDNWDQLLVSTHYGDWPSPEIFVINTQ